MTSSAAPQRTALVEALRAVPAGAPTLCEGWTAHDLAAHLVARERRPDSGPGLLIPAFAGWTERVRSGYARRPYPDLVDLVASGPPRTSPFALPGVDGAANTVEFAIHTEDVRRAGPTWEPRSLPAAEQDLFWRGLLRQGRLMFRRAPVTVVLARTGPAGEPDPAAERVRLAGSGPEVVLAGEPLELLLFSSGRGAHARVEPSGAPDAVRSLRELHLGL